ncbi:RNA polymerase recycling motor HelD [Virgibacillus sp. MG-45]|uniref:RNA polymerase recycling motor HelD n=1 Tax=Virgibacillus sp. MG-45 TaxID=3102791 RepID=UPI002ED98913
MLKNVGKGLGTTMNQGGVKRSEEQQRLAQIIEVIDEKAKKLYDRASGIKGSVVELRKDFWEDVTVNLDDPDDIIETQASIKQQAELLSERERTHGNIAKELTILKRLKDNPYFGRIDFLEDGTKDEEKVYIGIASLMDKEETDFLIYDWRAPIASLYYDFSPGRASYQTVDMEIQGDMTLKRQFIIRQGQLKGMFDTGVTIGDHLLQQALGNNASTTMKSIVATIQKEQNKIIRNEKSKRLVVQGVAGSGKTSAALQRIAYLMYRHREELHADNVVLLSPNPLFSSYTANVLPELGEANVRQVTFLQHIESKVTEKVTVQSPFQQTEDLLTADDQERKTRKKIIDYKSSPAFKELLDDYLHSLKQEGLQFKNIVFRKEILISKEAIASYFYGLDDQLLLPNKIELVRKWLLLELRRFEKLEKDKDWVMEQAELLDKADYLQAYYYNQKENEDDFSLEEDYLRIAIVKRYFSKLKKQINQLAFVHVWKTFKALFTQWQPATAPLDWQEISEYTVASLAKRQLLWEDAAPFAYLKGNILGDVGDRSVRHLVIDEAQDYTAFHYAYIVQQFPYTRITLLGDVNQAIYASTAKQNPLAVKEGTNDERITLTKSYRSTKEIVEFTKCFAPEKEEIEPFNRPGKKPLLIEVDSEAAWTKAIIAQIKAHQRIGHETIAVICKSQKESDMMYEALYPALAIKQINEETYAFEKGVLVLPVYLAKGIEFDAVVIPNASRVQYEKESDRSMFYTACTRAMHELTLFYRGKPNRFIEEVPRNFYDTHLGQS